MDVALVIAVTALILNIVALLGIFAKIVRWIDRQREQDKELAAIRVEQSIITVAVLVSLKSIAGEKNETEVKDTIKIIEKHLNDQAHK